MKELFVFLLTLSCYFCQEQFSLPTFPAKIPVAAVPSNISFSLIPIISNLTSVSSSRFVHFPKMNHSVLVIAQQSGQIIWVDLQNDTLVPHLLLDLSPVVGPLNQNYDERGVLGIEFHPQFNTTNPIFWVIYTNIYGNNISATCNESRVDHFWFLDEFMYHSDSQMSSKVRSLVTMSHPYLNHNGVNSIRFNPQDKSLYFGIGGL